jgi:hypothetical protein
MGRIYSTNWGEDEGIQVTGVKARRKEATKKTRT